MAFFGVEVKPAKPFTHSSNNVKGRLRISQATLGIGSATNNSLIQCNVGDKSPVLLCVLIPEKTESSQLDLEFDEVEDVVFSVIGPRSVYLTGYYVGNSWKYNNNSDTESYGEDVGNSESDESNHSTDEDKYEDSFINDDVLEESLPVLSNEDDIEMQEDKPNHVKGNPKRLKKRIQVIESDDEMSSEDSEDGYLLSVFKRKRAAKPVSSGIAENTDKLAVTTESIESTEVTKAANGECRRKAKHGCNSLLFSGMFSEKQIVQEEQEQAVSSEAAEKTDKLAATTDGIESKEVPNAENLNGEQERNANHGVNSLMSSDGMFSEKQIVQKEHDDSVDTHNEINVKDVCPNIPVNDVKDNAVVNVADNVNCDDTEEMKECPEDAKILETESGYHKEVKSEHTKAESGDIPQDLLINHNKQDTVTKMEIDAYPAQLDAECGPKSKKRRKELKGESVEDNQQHSEAFKGEQVKQEIVKDDMDKDETVMAEVDEIPNSNRDIEIKEDVVVGESISKKTKTKKKRKNKKKVAPVTTLPSGVVIEELAKGEPDGKVAVLGKKVKVYYTAMLKENGHVFDSNIGQNPYKFRLGNEEIIKGWNLGIDGMHVGDKRRLIIPPSMGYGNPSAGGDNVPPNSWLVYEVELVGVH